MKKSKIILGLISALAVSVGVASAVSAAMIGDVDNNGKLSPRDALAVLKNVAGIEIDSSYNVSVETADINQDAVVNASDAYLILTRSTGSEYWSPETEYKEPFSGTVYILGDSIAAQHNTPSYKRPLMGWGVIFDEYFVDTFVKNNKAVSSESTKSYLLGNSYNYAMDRIAEDDYVFIAFGHNDHTPGEMHDIDRTTPLGDADTEGTFQWHLKTKYIDPVLEKGGVPILLTAVCRATFDESGKFVEDEEHLAYGQAVVDLVAEYQEAGKNVYLIDTQKHTYDLYTELTKEEGGMEEVMSYHGLNSGNGSEWDFDSTHFCEKGARMLAEHIIESLKSYNLDIVRYLRSDWETVE